MRAPPACVRHALRLGKELFEVREQSCKRRTLLFGDIIDREERVAVLRDALCAVRLRPARGEERRDAVGGSARKRQRRAEEAPALREELPVISGEGRRRLFSKPRFKPRDERGKMRHLRARPALRLLDVDLLQRRARMLRRALANLRNLSTRHPMVAELHESRRKHIAKLQPIMRVTRRLSSRRPCRFWRRGERRFQKRPHLAVVPSGKKATRLAEQIGRRAAPVRSGRRLCQAARRLLPPPASPSHPLPPHSRRALCNASPSSRGSRRTPPHIPRNGRFGSRAPRRRRRGCASRSSHRAIRQGAC